jgi:hypothetical protein
MRTTKQKRRYAIDLTQRALRRTFNDLARAAQVNDLVRRSISGHLTDQARKK